jgi:hypothetical protein
MPAKPDTKRESSHTEKLVYLHKKIISFQTQLKKVLPHSLVSPKQTNQNKIANRPKFLQDVFLYCHLNSINPNYSKNGPSSIPTVYTNETPELYHQKTPDCLHGTSKDSTLVSTNGTTKNHRQTEQEGYQCQQQQQRLDFFKLKNFKKIFCNTWAHNQE